MQRVAISRLHRADWAEEALQETWLAAFRSAHTFNPRYAVRTWLWTILLNQCRRLAERQSTRRARLPAEEAGQAACDEVACNDLTPPARAIARERRRLLDRHLRRLPPAESDALRLRFFGGMTFAEIAETTDCALLTAKNRVRRGLMRLAEMEQIRSLAAAESGNRNDSWRRHVSPHAAAQASRGAVSPAGSGEES